MFQPEFGALRDEVRKALERYLSCGILAHGCARAHCQNPECNHSELIAFSCKRRGLCPSCDAKRSVLFAENLVEEVLLAAPHRHVVFTVPKRVRPYFKFNRELLKHLYSAAWESWKELTTYEAAGTPAAVLALHTAGDLLAFHPHIHGLFLSGVIQQDGKIVPVEVDREYLQELFADKVLLALHGEGLLTEEQVDNIKSWPHSGFNVFIGDSIPQTDKERLLFSARYLRKCPVSNERLSIVEKPGADAIVEYAAYKEGVKSVRQFSPLQFLAEVSMHIPDTFEQLTRFFGAYSCRSRGAAKERASDSVTALPKLDESRASASWARCMKKVFELDPLKCPKCGSAMKIKAFITAPLEIDRIVQNLKIPPQRAPPKLRYTLPLAA